MKEFLPIVLGSDENAYGICRQYYELYNVKSLILCAKRLVCTMHSKICDVMCFEDFDSEEVFVKKLAEVAEEKSKEYEKLLLIPCADGYLGLCSNNPELIEKYFANRFISSTLLDEFVTKDKFYNICEKFNLSYPKTVVCKKEDRLTVFDNCELKFPVVVKANNSNDYNYLHCDFENKKKVYFFDNKEDYLKVANAMNSSGYNDNLIIQEFIPGDDTCMRVVNTYSDQNGKLRFIIIGQPVLEEYAPYALGNYAAIISDCDKALYEQVKNFLESIGYIGYANFDLKYDSRDNTYKFFEINPRQGRSSFFATAAGYNMSQFIVNDVIKNDNKDCVYGDKTILWSTVPKSILFKYVKNQEVLGRIKKLIKDKKLKFTLLTKADFSFMRYAKIIKYYCRHFDNYKKYYFDK